MELDHLKQRVTRLEAREELVIEKAKGAAGAPATAVVISSVSDMARRVGALEERSARAKIEPPATGSVLP